MDYDGGKRVFNRLGPTQPQTDNRNQKVCYHWRAGNCSRFPCPFLHRELSAPVNGTTSSSSSSKRSHGFDNDQRSTVARRGGSNLNTWGRGGGRGGNVINNNNNNNVNSRGGGTGTGVGVKKDKVCNFWIQGSCSFGERCRYMHSWCTGGFGMLTQLEGHKKVVSGIALPAGSDKLYTGSRDETVRVWDCQSGQCAGVINLSGEVGCMLSEGPWMFVGLPNLVKAWNVQTSAELSLNGPVGQVYSMVVGNGLLFAGTQDGSILAWKYNAATNCFEPAASLHGHTSAVVTLVVGANRLYSGSMDKSIRVWNLENLQCLQTLTDHNDVVMSVLCWDQFLLSCSLDKTIKVWAATDSGNLEVTYTHSEEHGLLTLYGMHDLESKPVLLCSCNDNTVRAYDLPSFSERGKIYAKQEIRSIHGGPNIFFTGDGTGQVRVWQWLADQSATTTAAPA
ncbi:putative transcription factor C3H family [Helianthus annuus]|uniref:Putative zinc finger CCCH domain-containing protein 17 n=1 Tax=Helianthus annuus TaxID=4232 RepID=A0A251SSG7_HELAN|nr:zinc finger CCCH domain-containing protein 48 [Helianthus annuus]KAF5773649.1 putative transcription factor C3H family [Helianthus annuus]KAJ0481499.1 putative transcription factor C3H family [Helianthus annuus]KAJ0497945.1 putative transcription factor C3H family [Helianthus annuus]KAJ0663951.1 putative transcription factor C3H family [Helianthus annuus]KAJ0849469.1 putative transcription factor C3H family [Helianthus annuus]